jgi:hypothetical protein
MGDKIITLTKELNQIFGNANDDIKKMLLEQNIITRNKKISFTDSLYYKFLCSYKNSINYQVASELSFNDVDADVSNYYRKEQKIPLQFYCNTLSKLKSLFQKYTNKNNNLNVIAVDGTYNNTNFKKDKTLETTLNMGYYDVSGCVPIDIELGKYDNKNKEIKSLVERISDADCDLKNIIFVMDRAYFSYALFDLLNNKNIKFVIRVKNNCVHINNNKRKDIRIITYKTNVIEVKKNKDGKDVRLSRDLTCNIATNLDISYDDDKIKDIYKSRWDIEVFFKILKSSFKFEYLIEHNNETKECYAKTYIVILINFILGRLFEIAIKEKLTSTKKYNIKYNKSLSIDGIKYIIGDIIKATLTEEKIIKYSKCFLKKIYCERNKSNPRVSKRPFSKWYVKSYSDFYKYSKIIDCISNNNLESLNKNLKTEALTITLLE